MKYGINTITPSGCVLPVYEENGQQIGGAPIETGDFLTAREVLTNEAYRRVEAEWTPEKIAKRRTELEQMAEAQALMGVSQF